MVAYSENQSNSVSFWYDFLNSEKLEQFASSHRESYSQAQPFPHIVIDNFFPETILKAILDEFPQSNQIDWCKFNDFTQKKLASTVESQMGQLTRFFLYQLNSSIFIRFLEVLTGIKGIIPDPHYVGGGLHQIERGGYLKIHSDFNYHGDFHLDRRLNLLVYLNENWLEEYGGHLELWNKDMTACIKRVLPIFNRCVIFSTTDISFHGHPDPLMCPDSMFRRSLALYYYSNGRPSDEVSPARTTLFRERPGEHPLNSQLTPKQLLKKFVPPILLDLKNSLLPISKNL